MSTYHPRKMNLTEAEKERDASYIYGLMDVRNGSVFYVGSTMNMKRRYYQHIRGWSHGPEMKKIMDEMKRAGRFPIMTLLEKTTIYENNSTERKWIRKLYLEGHPLKNVTCIKNWTKD